MLKDVRAVANREIAKDGQAESPQYGIDTGKRLVAVRFGRRLSLDAIARYCMQLRADPAFQREMSEIVDLRAAEDIDLQADDFFQLADRIDPFSPEAKRAFVVRNSSQEHAARMHQILRTQRNMRVFRSIEEAESWISSGHENGLTKRAQKSR